MKHGNEAKISGLLSWKTNKIHAADGFECLLLVQNHRWALNFLDCTSINRSTKPAFWYGRTHISGSEPKPSGSPVVLIHSYLVPFKTKQNQQKITNDKADQDTSFDFHYYWLRSKWGKIVLLAAAGKISWFIVEVFSKFTTEKICQQCLIMIWSIQLRKMMSIIFVWWKIVLFVT